MRNKGHHEKIYRQVTPMEETIRQIQNAHQGDKAARDRLVTENTGLVWSIVRRFAVLWITRRLARIAIYTIASL